jgi:O-acetylserine/cysteine efflux transporter
MKAKTLFLGIAAPFCWGTGLTFTKPVVQHFPPIFMMAMVYAGIALLSVFTVRQHIKTPPAHVILIAALAVSIQGALLFIGLRGVTASTANLVLQVQVPVAVLLGWLLAGESLDRRKLIGTAIALVGVAVVIGLPAERPPLLPVSLIIIGACVWALGQVLARKLGRDPGVVLLKANALAATPQLALASWLLESGQWQAVTTAGVLEWTSLAFVGFVGFYLAYVAWYSLLRQASMDVAAPFVLLMTPFGLVSAMLVLGERMSPEQILGAVVLLLGLAVVNGLLPPRRAQRA